MAFRKLLLGTFLLAALITVALPGHSRLTGTVKLGMNYPLTGPYSVEGLDQIRAARMAVDEINAEGGILGRRVVLETRNSFSDVLQTEINVRDLIAAGSSMVFGGSSSAVAIAAAEICQLYNVPFFGTLTYSTATTLEHARRVSFRECNNSWMSAKLMAQWLNSRYADEDYFYVTADYTWGWTTEQSLRKTTGTENKKRHPGVLTPLGATDFKEVLEPLADDPPDVLVLVLFGKDMAYALRTAYELGLKNHCQIVVPNLTLGMAERAGSKAMQGVVGSLPWTWKVPEITNSRRGLQFVDSYVKRYHRYPSTSGASAYTIVYEYKSAVERAGTFDTADVIRELEGHEFELLKDRQTWRALDHQCVQSMYMVRGNPPETVLDDPLRLDFFEILYRMDGDRLVLSEKQWREKRIRLGLPPHLQPLDGAE
jgi:ABC-type branched-subunit amino acid transport system substrate-binding protein